MANILVTGATGPVGLPLIRHLTAEGHEVAAASRRPDALPVEVRPRRIREIGPETDWLDALFDVEVVIHLAAAPPEADPATQRRVNTAGTRQLAQAAARHGVRRMILLLPALVPPPDETPPRDPWLRSRHAGEVALRKVDHATGLEAVVLRVPPVIAPRARGAVRALLHACRDRRWLPFKGLESRFSVIGPENLTAAVAALVEAGDMRDRLLAAADAEPVTLPGLAERLSGALNRRPRLIKLPRPLWRLAHRETRAAATLAGWPDLDTAPFRALTGWDPESPTDQAIRRTAGWIRGRV